MIKWRLKKTLSRSPEIRPIEDKDVKYAWAAYKSGALDPMGLLPNLDPEGFRQQFEIYVLGNAEAGWTITADTKKGRMPIGFVLGGWAPQRAYMAIIGIIWFPWASKRNIIEGTVGFFNRLRKEMKWIGFASDKDKSVYEVCCMHGIMRRIGTSQMAGNSAVFEGRN